MSDFQRIRDNIRFSMTGEGLWIELLETEPGMFFISGKATPTEAGSGLLEVLGWLGNFSKTSTTNEHECTQITKNAGRGWAGLWFPDIRITRSDTSGFTLRFRLTIRVSEIVNERHGITADTALRLARHFGTNADSWMNLQRDDELILK